MNSFYVAFIMCLLSEIMVIECGYGPRSSYDDYNDDYDVDQRYDYDYQTHYQRYNPNHYPSHYPRHYPRSFSKISAAYKRRVPKDRALEALHPNIQIRSKVRSGCFKPRPTEMLDLLYEHPRNGNCLATFKEGDIYCFDRKTPEPRIFRIPIYSPFMGTTMEDEYPNPLYNQICPDAPAVTTSACYAPKKMDELTYYQHPMHPDCFVIKDTGDVACRYVYQKPYIKNSEGIEVESPLYKILCSFYCPHLKPNYCTSLYPLVFNISSPYHSDGPWNDTSLDLPYIRWRVKRGPKVNFDQHCIVPPPSISPSKYYFHPGDYFNHTCVVTFKEGDVFCNGRHLTGFPPEPRNISVYNPDHGETGTLYVDEPNPLYFRICPNATAYTSLPCYTPPISATPEVSEYQHPTNQSCMVSYADGLVRCDGVLKSTNDSANYELYHDLCTTHCPDLRPYICTSTQPKFRETIIETPQCYVPEPKFNIKKYYNHPLHYFNDSCVVSYLTGEVYCKDRHLLDMLPEPRIIRVYRSGTTGYYTDERNPLYWQICANAPAKTFMPCYTPPEPLSLGTSQYQHPTARNCLVSYDKGKVSCDGVEKDRHERINEPLYQVLCSTYCEELMPYRCTSTLPLSCMTCDYETD